ncbi:hypothetical protein [Pseudactinotalea sp. HY160]|uniref:hypothetical protein n=1 Tax=Pseudactinotalea sp. HY160 TaxID=2654490 RepID=UPI001883A589|nr:hypothetical protein [Pseudactinotalea sp. HY160]
MAESSQASGYQSVGNGVYRVTGAMRRSAITGRYVTTKSSAPATGRRAAPEQKRTK